MNDGLLRVDFGRLAQASADIKRAIAALDSRLGQLNAEGKSLTESWEGKAKGAYFDRQQTWDTAATDLKVILGDIQRAVDRAADDYAATESSAAKRFS